jgi:hypothetical protein
MLWLGAKRRRSMDQATGSKTGPETVVDDYDEIYHVVQLCLEGESHGDAVNLEEAFHADARLFVSGADRRLYNESIAEHLACVGRTPAYSSTHRWRILSVQQSGNAAAAVVAEDGAMGWASFVTYFVLARDNDVWKIVAGVAQYTGGERYRSSEFASPSSSA